MAKKLLKYSLLIILFFGLSWYVTSNWDVEALQNISPNWQLVTLSCSLLILFFLTQSYIAYLLIKAKPKIPLFDFIPIFFISQLGRYIPGKVWVVVGRVELLKRKGVDREWGVFISFLEMFLMLVGAGMIVISGMLFIDFKEFESYKGLLITLLLVSFLILLKLKFVYQLVKKLLKRFSLDQKINLPDYPFQKFELQKFVLFNLILWIMIGGGFHLLITSLVPNNPGLFYSIIVFAASWTIGFLSLISPSGIGVRESVMIALLSPFLSPTEASIVAISSRIWFTGIELLLSALIILGRNLFPTTIQNLEKKTEL